MKIRYIQLREGKSLNIPGAGNTAKISANGRDGFFSGMCKYIARDEDGYVLTWVGGQNAGTYHVPFVRVDHAKWEMNDAEAEAFHAAAASQSEFFVKLADAVAVLPDDAKTGATTKPQKSVKPAKA